MWLDQDQCFLDGGGHKVDSPAKEAIMSALTVNCPNCTMVMELSFSEMTVPFYVFCSGCGKQFVIEPHPNGVVVYVEEGKEYGQ